MAALPIFSSIATGITQVLSGGLIFEILPGLLSYSSLLWNWCKLPGSLLVLPRALSVIYASLFSLFGK
jgi:hypothetical protein